MIQISFEVSQGRKRCHQPWIRESNSGPSTDKRETSELAVISPMASSASAMYTAMAGKMDGAYNLSGKRFTQRKVMAGADLIWL